MGNLCGKKGHEFEENSDHDVENPTPLNSNDNNNIDNFDYGDDEFNKLDPNDFICMSQNDNTIIKLPGINNNNNNNNMNNNNMNNNNNNNTGAINGQQFQIEDCKNCDIFLLDYADSVNVDACVNCRIFIGPCSSSVFIRDCQSIKLVVASQQLRFRDCSDIDALIYVSAGQPSIESSDNIKFGCFQYSYFSLKQQFDAAGLSIWNNRWSNVYDFTPDEEKKHWQYLPQMNGCDLLKRLHEIDSVTFQEGEDNNDSIVPYTYGDSPHIDSNLSKSFILASINEENFLLNLINSQPKKVYFIRSQTMQLDKHQLQQLINDDHSLATSGKFPQQFIGVEVRNLAKDIAASNQVYITHDDDDDVESKCELYFNEMVSNIN